MSHSDDVRAHAAIVPNFSDEIDELADEIDRDDKTIRALLREAADALDRNHKRPNFLPHDDCSDCNLIRRLREDGK